MLPLTALHAPANILSTCLLSLCPLGLCSCHSPTLQEYSLCSLTDILFSLSERNLPCPLNMYYELKQSHVYLCTSSALTLAFHIEKVLLAVGLGGLKNSVQELICESNLLCSPMRFPCGSAGKESACNAEDLGSIPG